MKSLVLVLGAGASKEVNLPVSAELRAKIAQLLDIRFEFGLGQKRGDGLIARALHTVAANAGGGGGDINPLLELCWKIRDAMPQAISIDSFIDSHAGDPQVALCGKLAIGRSILAAEASSTLTIDEGNIYNKLDFTRSEKSWFNWV